MGLDARAKGWIEQPDERDLPVAEAAAGGLIVPELEAGAANR
jgi:hypothetical protein